MAQVSPSHDMAQVMADLDPVLRPVSAHIYENADTWLTALIANSRSRAGGCMNCSENASGVQGGLRRGTDSENGSGVGRLVTCRFLNSLDPLNDYEMHVGRIGHRWRWLIVAAE